MEYSQNKTELFGLIEEASLITMIGSTGSGKGSLIFSYLDYLSEKHLLHEMGIRAYDLSRSDYCYKDPVYKWVEERRCYGEQIHTGLIEDATLVQDRISGFRDATRKIFIHITECDLLQGDERANMLKLCKLVAEHGKEAGVQLLYETSRPSIDMMPEELVSSSDLRIVAHTTVVSDIERFMPEANILPELDSEGRNYFICNKTSNVSAFKLVLNRHE